MLSLKAQKGPHGLLTFIKFISYLFLYNVGTGCARTFSAPFFLFFFCIIVLLTTLKCMQLSVDIIIVVQASLLPHYTCTFQLGLFDFSIIVWGPTTLSHPVLHCFYEWMIFHCVAKSHFGCFLLLDTCVTSDFCLFSIKPRPGFCFVLFWGNVGCVFSFLGMYPKVQFWEHMKIVCVSLCRVAKLFSKGAAQFYINKQRQKGKRILHFSTCSLTLISSLKFVPVYL